MGWNKAEMDRYEGVKKTPAGGTSSLLNCYNWVLVEDALPKLGECVLCYCRSEYGGEYYYALFVWHQYKPVVCSQPTLNIAETGDEVVAWTSIKEPQL